MGTEMYDRLVAKLPEMAEAVKVFDGAGLQERAFDALSSALLASGPAPGSDGTGAGGKDAGSRRAGATRTRARKAGAQPIEGHTTRPPRARRGNFVVEKGLDFRPSGTSAFKDYVTEKAPSSLNERNTVAVFYLKEFMNVDKVAISHVLAAFREAGWKPAAQPDTALRKTASAQGWLDTSSSDDIRLTPSGSYLVEHELPREKRAV
jgi:hypothetical protein